MILGWEDLLEKGKAAHSSILLENSLDCIVHWVTKSWTQLSNCHFHSHHRSLGKLKLKPHTIDTLPKRQTLRSAGKLVEKVESLDIAGKNGIW